MYYMFIKDFLNIYNKLVILYNSNLNFCMIHKSE